MRERPTIRQLEYFVALAEHLNFRRAAEDCYVTQPTLSVQMKQLEQLLGQDLFERDRRHVLLTNAGENLLPMAHGVLRALDDFIDAAQCRGQPLTGPLRVGVIPTIAPYLLPRVLVSLRQRYPELQLFVREDQTSKLLEMLGRGELDVLVLAKEAKLGELTILDLFRDPFLLAVSEDHDLASLDIIGEGDLKGQRLILLEDGH